MDAEIKALQGRIILELEELRDFILGAGMALYQYNDALGMSSSIGMHTRHVIGYFQQLFDYKEGGVLDYGNRHRDQQLEHDPIYAAAALDHLIDSLHTYTDNVNIALRFRHALGIVDCTSTLAREMIFCLEHCVHHKALVRQIAVFYEPNMELNKGFGFADSTLIYLAGHQNPDS